MKVAPVIVRKHPVLEKFRNRYTPEYSRDNEELYCNGMMAEDGTLRLYRDRLAPGFPVVEVHVGDEIIDLRGCPVFTGDHGTIRHPRWPATQKKVLDWLRAHDRPEANSYRLGYWVYDRPLEIRKPNLGSSPG